MRRQGDVFQVKNKKKLKKKKKKTNETEINN